MFALTAKMDVAILKKLKQLNAFITAKKISGILDIIPSYHTLTLVYDISTFLSNTENATEQLQLFMDYVNKGLIDNQVFKNFPDAKKIIDNCLKSYLDWLVKNSRGDVENTRTWAIGYSTLFYHAHREFGEDVMLMRPGQMSKIVQNDAYDRTRFEQIINGKYILTPEQEQAKEDEINNRLIAIEVID